MSRPTLSATATLTAAAALAIAAALTGCADRADPRAAGDGEAPREGGTVVVAGPSDLDYANPLLSGEAWTQEINRYLLFLPLVRYDSALDYTPALAESWELHGDTGVTFHLRRDVAWHDGRPTTAHDVAFTYRRATDPETGFPNAGYFESWTGALVVDSFTVRFGFEPHAEPLAGWPFLPIAPRHLLEDVPPARLRNAPFNTAPVGNGPFRFAEYRPNDRWMFEANTAFPEALGGRPNVDRFVWRVVPDNNAQVIALRTGEADVALTPTAEQFRELGAREDIRGIVRPSRRFALIGWNALREPFDDARVRRALALAIDKRAIIDGLRGGYGQPGITPIAPFSWAFDDSLEPLPHDTAAARTLLREAGVSGLELELLIANTPINRDMAELVRADLGDVGVTMTAVALDPAAFFATISNPAREFDAALLGWEDDYRPNLRPILHTDARGGPFAFVSYANPEVDALIDTAAVTADRDRSRPLYHRLQRILLREQPWSVLYYWPDLLLARERVRGLDADPRGALADVIDWWLAIETGDAAAEPDSTPEGP